MVYILLRPPSCNMVFLTQCKVTIKALPFMDDYVINPGALHFKQKTSNLSSRDHDTKNTCSFLVVTVASRRVKVSFTVS